MVKVVDHNRVKQNYQTAKTVTKNVIEFYDALCLAGVSGFAIWQALDKYRGSFWYKLLLLAGVTIALQAFILLVRSFNKVSKES
jgi:hypothetical protein